MKINLVFLALVLTLTNADARIKRSQSEVNSFKADNPCPSTGKGRGACAGYVVDHVVPLCAGGLDAKINMQWQSLAESKIKDREEKRQCAMLRRNK